MSYSNPADYTTRPTPSEALAESRQADADFLRSKIAAIRDALYDPDLIALLAIAGDHPEGEFEFTAVRAMLLDDTLCDAQVKLDNRVEE